MAFLASTVMAVMYYMEQMQRTSGQSPWPLVLWLAILPLLVQAHYYWNLLQMGECGGGWRGALLGLLSAAVTAGMLLSVFGLHSAVVGGAYTLFYVGYIWFWHRWDLAATE